MKAMLVIFVLAFNLCASNVFSGNQAAEGQAQRQSLSRAELLGRNAKLKQEIVQLKVEREALKKSINDLRSFMFHINEEFKKLDQTDKKKRKISHDEIIAHFVQARCWPPLHTRRMVGSACSMART